MYWYTLNSRWDGLEIHTFVLQTPSKSRVASIYQLLLLMRILQTKFCLFAQLFGLRCSWLPWSLSYSSRMLYKGYSRHYHATTCVSWGWEKKWGRGGMPLTLGFFMRSVTITSLYKIQCALENKRCFQPCSVWDHQEKKNTWQENM